jgi:hypothetical protein
METIDELTIKALADVYYSLQISNLPASLLHV